MLKYNIVNEENGVQVTLHGDLDIEGTEIIKEELLPNLLNSKEVNVSFEKVPFVDSSGMGLLITLVNSLKENNSKVTISNVKEEVFEIFELLQLPEILGEEVFV
ncbi:STAS domain-containing protein [Oceanobacillus salinisoli]|uniref:STAS domain-containing protein n=1 Tax=Oceanobacillus salinisoli TaxID=2678611 RepID=UPI0012E1D165|nr:STAS domain-containing protein [Oceanobacillus salinisoli]